jgi:predicted acetyltransferase
MSLTLSWHGRESAEEVGRTRALCYAPGARDIPAFQERLANDPRVVADDLLLARRDGAAVGTATSYSMNMWVRGRAFPCQGVAYVGTVKTSRRSGGVASQVMGEVLRRGRERGQVLSALLPFRASFYEHFGYGVVERRATWTIPLVALPGGPVDGFEFLEGADDPRRACRQRMVEAGQCDVERTAGMWTHWTRQEDEGFVVGDRQADDSLASWFTWSIETVNGESIVEVDDMAFDSSQALLRGLRFFGTLRDQYSAVRLTLPAEFQVNRLLRETQVPRRAVAHPTATVELYTRLQVRVLDHVRLINGLQLPREARGGLVVAVTESEGTTSTFRIEFESGRALATETSAPPDVECVDRHWAAILLGDLPATRAAEMGLIKAHRPAATELLDAFAGGPAPFCNESF